MARAFPWARPDGIVLLSPAAPSFGRFRDYRDRGDQFAAAMRALAAPSRPSVRHRDAQVVGEQRRERHQLQRVDPGAAQAS